LVAQEHRMAVMESDGEAVSNLKRMSCGFQANNGPYQNQMAFQAN
jgi:hypothetical protein